MNKITPSGGKITVTIDIERLVQETAFLRLPDGTFARSRIADIVVRTARIFIGKYARHLLRDFAAVGITGTGAVTITFYDNMEEVEKDAKRGFIGKQPNQ